MPTITTSQITIPDQILDPFIKKIQHGSTIAQLSTPEPMKFGKGVWESFDSGEAEFVGEGANKSSMPITKTAGTILPFKFQKTVRFTNEVEWTNEDHRLMVIESILRQIPRSLARALDFGVIHGVNPLTLQPVAAMTSHGKLTDATATQAVSGDITADLDWAYAEVLRAGHVPNGVALAPGFAVDAVVARDKNKVKLFPEFRPTTELSTLDAFRASTSDTVSAVGSTLALAGDFDAVRWGIQKQMGLEKIEYGDPDGGGDLKRNNQVAFRAEVVYGWGFDSLDAFALLNAAEEEGD